MVSVFPSCSSCQFSTPSQLTHYLVRNAREQDDDAFDTLLKPLLNTSHSCLTATPEVSQGYPWLKIASGGNRVAILT